MGEGLVADTWLERYVQGVVFSVVFADLVKASSAWEEVLAVLMEGNRHTAVAEVEGFFDSVAVMDVDVEVEDSWVDLKELQDGKDDVVYVAETAGLGLFRVVKAASPVDGNVGGSVEEEAGGIDGGAGRDLAHVVEAIEGGAVSGFSDFVPLPHFQVVNRAELSGRVVEAVDANEGHFVGEVLGDVLLKVLEVVFGVEFAHFVPGGLAGMVDVEAPVQSRVDDQGVGHSYPLGLHGVLLRVYELAEVLVVEV